MVPRVTPAKPRTMMLFFIYVFCGNLISIEYIFIIFTIFIIFFVLSVSQQTCFTSQLARNTKYGIQNKNLPNSKRLKVP